MRSWLVGVVALGWWFMEPAFAAQTADITVTVTVRKLSVSVGSATFAFGSVNESSQTVASAAVAVTSDGNVTEDFELKLTNPIGWTAVQSGTPNTDQYLLGSIFRTASPAAGDFTDSQDTLSTTFVTSSTTVFAKDADANSQKGFSVATSGARNLWFLFFAPSYSTIGTQQSIVVTVRATAS